MTKIQNNLLLIAIVLSAFSLDMYTKWAILQTFNYQPYPLSDSISVIDIYFKLTYVQNFGITFGLLSDLPKPYTVAILSITSSIALIILGYFYHNISKLLKEVAVPAGRIALAMILGGALGNIIDRMIRGFVVDFLDFGIATYRWYTFNVADIFIVSGCILLSILIIFFEIKEDKTINKSLT